MLTVSPVRAFEDNYIWLIHGARDHSRVAIVDPGEPGPVLEALDERELELDSILITHHHGDHVGGVPELVRKFDVPVFGPANERIPEKRHALHEGTKAELPGLGLSFDVMDIPAHTAGHIAYYGHNAVFCGDTMFSAGCGRLFEGTPADMHRALTKLAALPESTNVYCGHEYTLANLRFALCVEPNNDDSARYMQEAKARRERGEPTLPSTIGLERKVNPFVRCDQETVRTAAERHSGKNLQNPVDVLAEIRSWKDDF